MTNVEVLLRVNAIRLSVLLREQQLILFAKIYRRPPHDVLRQVAFQAGSDALVVHRKRRRRGRLKLVWAAELRKIAVKVCEGRLQDAMDNAESWKRCVKKSAVLNDANSILILIAFPYMRVESIYSCC